MECLLFSIAFLDGMPVSKLPFCYARRGDHLRYEIQTEMGLILFSTAFLDGMPVSSGRTTSCNDGLHFYAANDEWATMSAEFSADAVSVGERRVAFLPSPWLEEEQLIHLSVAFVVFRR